jgi:hypothetical protein
MLFKAFDAEQLLANGVLAIPRRCAAPADEESAKIRGQNIHGDGAKLNLLRSRRISTTSAADPSRTKRPEEPKPDRWRALSPRTRDATSRPEEVIASSGGVAAT